MINKKRIAKRARLLKKLFDDLINTTEAGKYKDLIHFRVGNKRGYKNRSYFKGQKNIYSGKIEKVIIKFDIELLKNLSFFGFTADYYNCRGFLLSALLQHNKKLTTRFIILHEIKHAIDYCKGYSNNYFYDKKVCEGNADKFAINYLRYKGLING